MATRFYFPDALAADLSPTIGSEWEHQNVVRRALLLAPDTSALATTAYTPDTADHLVDQDAHHRQYVSAPIAAQTVSGNVKAQFQCLEANAGNNLFLTVKVFVCGSDGATKETLLAITRDPTLEVGTALTNRTFSSIALASATVEEGDRVVVEVGLGGTPTASGGTQGHNGSLRWGCSAAGGDLPENDTDTGTTLRPWIEFDDDIVFLQPTGEAASISAPQPTQRSPAALGWLYGLLTTTLAAPPAAATQLRAAIFSLPPRPAWRPPQFVFQTLLLTTLAVAVAAPIVASAQDLPRRPAVASQTWTQNLLESTLSVAAPSPFFQTDWPLPRVAVPAITLRTWIDALRLNLLGKDAVFGAAGQTTTYDWPNPRVPAPSIALRTWLDNRLLDTLAFVQPRPFAQLEWPIPKNAVPAVVLKTWIDALRLPLLGQDRMFGAPGQPAVYAWPNPIVRPSALDLRASFGNLLQTTLGIVRPFAQYQWPNPILRVAPSELRVFLNLLESTLAIQRPFAMLDWPNPRTRISVPPSFVQPLGPAFFPPFVPAGLILVSGEIAIIPTARGEGVIIVTATGELFFIPTADGESSVTGSGG
jgi:hypothetical protein